MAEPSYANPETIINFHVIPATALRNDSEVKAVVWDVTVGDNQNQVVAKITFLKSAGLIDVHGTEFIVSKMININHVSQILVVSTDDDTKSINHFDRSNNLTIIDGPFNPLHWHQYPPWESANLGIKDVAVYRAIQGNLPFPNGNSVPLLNPARFPFETSGYSVDKDDNGNDGSGNGRNDGGDGNGDGGNNGGNGGNDGHGVGGSGGGNGNSAANIRIHRFDKDGNCIEIIKTSIVADEFPDWLWFALAIYSVWLERNPEYYHTAAYADVDPSTCWPGYEVSFGQVAEDGSSELYDWQTFKFLAVRNLITDVVLHVPEPKK